MLSYSTQLIDEEDINAVVEVLKSPFITQGKRVEAFEEALCSFTNANYAVAFNSATSALLAAYSVAGICEGDEVITSPVSFVATSNMFVSLGAKPIWCDVKEDGNLDEEKLEALITSKTKAIVPVHFAGKSVEIEKILEIADRYNLLVIEDGAHALGSSTNARMIGSISPMSIFSFHAIKPITTGEGGAVMCDSLEYAKALRLFRSHGMVKKELWDSNMQSMGYNFRMTEIAASMGITQLLKLPNFIEQRNAIAHYYEKVFKDVVGFKTIKLNKTLLSSRHLYPILLDSKLHKYKKGIFKELQKSGLGVQVHYKPIYQNSFYTEKFGELTLEGAEEFYKSEISIPCHQKMSLEDAKSVAKTLLQIIGEFSKKEEC